MMVTFVSQCEKKALPRTRRVLDSFADRIGDNVWQTVITEEGLKTVKKMLRRTASKSTAVSCHWIRSRSRTEFLWSVGRKDVFDSEGRVPVNQTEKQYNPIESNWQIMPSIKALVAIAGLFHDWGKSSACFQSKLKDKKKRRQSDPLRHEWVSCQLLRAFIDDAKTDEDWLKRLQTGDIAEDDIQKNVCHMDKPLKDLPPIASLVMWLILTHHRMPVTQTLKGAEGYKTYPLRDFNQLFNRMLAHSFSYANEKREADIATCWEFPDVLFKSSSKWTAMCKKWAGRLLEEIPAIENAIENQTWRQILHFARLSLMLGDYSYSSQGADTNWKSPNSLYANTDKKNGRSVLKQKLDEHLVGVTRKALAVSHRLSEFESKMPYADGVRELKKKSPKQFQWQDKAVTAIEGWRREEKNQKPFGFFIVNMASTGCGKTFANAKMMRALSKDGDSLRFILALGLRTLTLQTGDEYRERVGLDDSELAVLIGSSAIRRLNENKVSDEIAEDDVNNTGSESSESLLDNELSYDCDISEDNFVTILPREKDRQFLYAPVLACTIDHLMGATETRRGGRYILPCLRLMSSDLVIDEIDDFSGDDLIAIGRLVHLAGMLGRKVMISSATIPPSLAEGYFHVYQEGWRLFATIRGLRQKIGCAWVDEFNTAIWNVTAPASKRTDASFYSYHRKFVEKRCREIGKDLPPKRSATIVALPDDNSNEDDDSLRGQYYSTIQKQTVLLHVRHHMIDPHSGKNVSFGVVRVANIRSCVELAAFLSKEPWPNDVDAKIMAYHSQQVLLLRHEQEAHLDKVLKRKKPNEVFDNPIIRSRIDGANTQNVVFILVATPVEEVGRDHDFDWAIVEPSSFRSIIQLAGRVRRHREAGNSESANIALLNYNIKGYIESHADAGNSRPVFCRPGYEDSSNRLLAHHDLQRLLQWKDDESIINAIPRIRENAALMPQHLLADLEHCAISDALNAYEKGGPESLEGWVSHCWWLTALPQMLTPFRKSTQNFTLYLLPDEDAESDSDCGFHEKDSEGRAIQVDSVYGIKKNGEEIPPERQWFSRDYLNALSRIAKREGRSLRQVALTYGEISIPLYDSQIGDFIYSNDFGMIRSR